LEGVIFMAIIIQLTKPRQLLLRMRTVFYTAGSTVARNGEAADRCLRRWWPCRSDTQFKQFDTV
jgi:hypothetical protein